MELRSFLSHELSYYLIFHVFPPVSNCQILISNVSVLNNTLLHMAAVPESSSGGCVNIANNAIQGFRFLAKDIKSSSFLPLKSINILP